MTNANAITTISRLNINVRLVHSIGGTDIECQPHGSQHTTLGSTISSTKPPNPICILSLSRVNTGKTDDPLRIASLAQLKAVLARLDDVQCHNDPKCNHVH
ncbi:hypothetical protein RP20_CCG013413 [Aedes albopictus]|nr:hypothetical protein RP20_CCG013413 [Aedes albopictus]